MLFDSEDLILQTWTILLYGWSKWSSHMAYIEGGQRRVRFQVDGGVVYGGTFHTPPLYEEMDGTPLDSDRSFYGYLYHDLNKSKRIWKHVVFHCHILFLGGIGYVRVLISFDERKRFLKILGISLRLSILRI